MRAKDLRKLGDEPIYCEAQHDDVMYSGSEDDYYEAPEHRRLRIEAKAVQFLNGNIPYLLSGRLHGPFGAKTWDNPWKSRRSQRQANNPGTQSRHSLTTVEVARGHSSLKTADHFPDTQRTSLYPLPSPETTNPPSIRKNAYVGEDVYNRIKSWREAVKSIPVTKDPFWASRQAEIQDVRGTTKRPADQNWLHKRVSKKRRSADMTSPLDNSPSQTAAKTRRKQAGGFSETVTQSAQASSTHKAELAAHFNAHFSSFDTSRLANMSTGVPFQLRTTQKSQLSEQRLPREELESSEDELSMPSTTPARKVARSPRQKSLKLTGAPSPSRRQPVAKGDSAPRSKCGQADEEKTEDERVQCLRTFTNNRPGLDRVKSLAAKTARRALEASQQDDSFYFHARPKSPAERSQVQHSPTHQTDGTTLTLPSAQPHAPASAGDDVNSEGDDLQPENQDNSVMAHFDDETDLENNDKQEGPLRSTVGPETIDEAAREGEAGSVGLLEVEAKPHLVNSPLQVRSRPREEPRAAIQPKTEKSDAMCVEPDTERSTHVCTQELSPVSMKDSPRVIAGVAVVLETTTPRSTPSMNDAVASDPEWSTYLNTQDLSTASENLLSRIGDVQGLQIALPVPHNPADSQWTIFSKTQELATISSGERQTPDKADGIEIVQQSPDDPSDPQWSTFLETQDQPTTHSEQLEGLGEKSRSTMDVDANKQGDDKTVLDDEVESDSEWSTYMSASSHIYDDRTGDASHEPVPTETAASAATPSQVSAEWSIDAHAQGTQNISCGLGSNAAAEIIQDNGSLSPHREDEKMLETELRSGQDDNGSNETLEDTSVSVAQADNDGQAVTRLEQEHSSTDLDGTTASIEPTQIQVPLADEMSNALRSPDAPKSDTEAKSASRIMDGTLAGIDSPQSQSPWHGGGEIVLRTLTGPQNDHAMLDDDTARIEPEPSQSPWVKGATHMPMPVAMENDTTVYGSSSKPSVLAGEEALAFSEGPRTPWLGDRLPSPTFSLSVKRFSDFMKLSPKKNRVSPNGSILRGSGTSSRVDFEIPVPLKSNRRVTFAPLPGQQEEDLAEAEVRDDDELYVEQDVSYFDPEGNKTTSIRITRPTARASSPPPLNMSTVDAGELPDHDDKFAKHFAAMSKRKTKPFRRTPRLLPSDSQLTNGSQGVGAMAEAFIQASQTKTKGAELAETTAAEHAQGGDLLARKNCRSIDHLENQENITPVDDVSAVLDNLDDFLENTWGVDMSMDIDTEKETQAQQQTSIASNRFDNIGDPMLALNTNIWAD